MPRNPPKIKITVLPSEEDVTIEEAARRLVPVCEILLRVTNRLREKGKLPEGFFDPTDAEQMTVPVTEQGEESATVMDRE